MSASQHPEALQVTAQSWAWKYMSTSLEAEFGRAKATARAALDTKRNEVTIAEADIAEGRVRFETERLIRFYDELGDKQVGITLFLDATAEEKPGRSPRKLRP